MSNLEMMVFYAVDVAFQNYLTQMVASLPAKWHTCGLKSLQISPAKTPNKDMLGRKLLDAVCTPNWKVLHAD